MNRKGLIRRKTKQSTKIYFWENTLPLRLRKLTSSHDSNLVIQQSTIIKFFVAFMAYQFLLDYLMAKYWLYTPRASEFNPRYRKKSSVIPRSYPFCLKILQSLCLRTADKSGIFTRHIKHTGHAHINIFYISYIYFKLFVSIMNSLTPVRHRPNIFSAHSLHLHPHFFF